jgi:hypothetical protein
MGCKHRRVESFVTLTLADANHAAVWEKACHGSHAAGAAGGGDRGCVHENAHRNQHTHGPHPGADAATDRNNREESRLYRIGTALAIALSSQFYQMEAHDK